MFYILIVEQNSNHYKNLSPYTLHFCLFLFHCMNNTLIQQTFDRNYV